MFRDVEETYVEVKKGGRDSGVEDAAGVGACQEGMKEEPIHGCSGELSNESIQLWSTVELDHAWYFTSCEKSPLEVSTFGTFFVFILIKCSQEHT